MSLPDEIAKRLLWLDGPFVHFNQISRVEVAMTLVGRLQAKSLYVDLEDNFRENYSRFKATSQLQTKSSLRLDSQYNMAFIQVQTVLCKRYISRYVS